MRLWGKTKRSKAPSEPIQVTIPVAGQVPLVWMMGEHGHTVAVTREIICRFVESYGHGLLMTTDPDAENRLEEWLEGIDYDKVIDSEEVRAGVRRMLEKKNVLVMHSSSDDESSESVIESVREMLRAIRNMPEQVRSVPFLLYYGLPPAGITELSRAFTELKVPVLCISEQHYIWRQEEGEAIDALINNFSCHLDAGPIEEVVTLTRPGIGLCMQIGDT